MIICRYDSLVVIFNIIAVLFRALSAGLFFPLEEIFRDIVQGSVDKTSRFRPMVTLLAGAAAGSTYGIMMNPISSIKYNYWGKAECGKENFLSTAVNMYKRGGVALFFVGTSATVLRDLIFGSVFSILRHDILISKDTDTNRKSKKNSDRMNAFFIDIASASIATIASSPLNYVRDMQYSMTNDKPKSIRGQFRQLWEDTLRETSSYDRAVLLQRKLRIGWGTARVGCGMGVGSFLYSYCSRS